MGVYEKFRPAMGVIHQGAYQTSAWGGGGFNYFFCSQKLGVIHQALLYLFKKHCSSVIHWTVEWLSRSPFPAYIDLRVLGNGDQLGKLYPI